MRPIPRRLFCSFLLATWLASCAAPGKIALPSLEIPLRQFPADEPVPTPTSHPSQASETSPTAALPVTLPTQPPPPTSTNTPLPYPLWIEPALPDALREAALAWNLPPASSASTASLQLGFAAPYDKVSSTWVYALVAPFPTTLDGVTLADLQAAWSDSSSGPMAGSPLWMAESTQRALTAVWGEAGPGAVQTAPADELVEKMWQSQPSWGIVPFEALEPKLKVLAVDGQSPIHNDFDEAAYPLKVNFSLVSVQPIVSPLGTELQLESLPLPAANRDPSKLTVLLMTGVTALVRATAVRMEIVGVDYPAWNIGDTLKAADITHISNEIPFFNGCPYPDPRQEGLVFCSNPKYIELLELVGADIVELTGNHFQDYGSQATLDTLEMYKERNWPYYGGGADLADSQKPAILEHNGNRFAFLGCNPIGPGYALATEDSPGAAPCEDYEWMKGEIARLEAEGYFVIATFQYEEYYQAEPTEVHRSDFRAIAEAGATIVSGSQAHVPQAMEFYNGAFVHYGLGNLFFDQMSGPSRREFLDRHVFYNGRYISIELVTAMLEDYARPRLMRPEERTTFLEMMFEASGWGVEE
ncbi:MAG: CapA family protein [Chloroflexota bacterium]